MARYTIELRYLIENGSQLPLSSYPIFQESYRSELNQKIIDYFYFREIGFEVPGLFANRLKLKMEMIMPYYNKLYEQILADVDPMVNQDWQETSHRDLGRTKKTEQSSSGTSTDQQSTSQTGSAHLTGKDTGTESGSEDRREQSSGTGTASGSSTSHTSASSSADQSDTGTDTTTTSTTRSGKQVRSDTPQGLLQASSVNDDTWASEAQLDSGSDSGKTTLEHSISSDQSSQTSTDVDGTTSQSTENSTSGTSNTIRSAQSTADRTEDQSSSSNSSTQAQGTTSSQGSGSEQEDVGETVLRSVKGRQGITWAQVFTEYREALVSVDMLIMHELEELFMRLW